MLGVIFHSHKTDRDGYENHNYSNREQYGREFSIGHSIFLKSEKNRYNMCNLSTELVKVK